jgi:hypothetical protein
VFLRTPQDSYLCFIFGGCWGTCLGWLQPQNTSAYVPILPKNKEAEMMGLYLFACQIFSWLPPTVFTIMNEFHMPMSYGLGSLCIYFLTSILFLYMIGDYNAATNRMTTNNTPTEIHRNHLIDHHHHHHSYAATEDNVDIQSATRTSFEMTTRPIHSATSINKRQDSNVYFPISPSSSSIQQRNDKHHQSPDIPDFT